MAIFRIHLLLFKRTIYDRLNDKRLCNRPLGSYLDIFNFRFQSNDAYRNDARAFSNHQVSIS